MTAWSSLQPPQCQFGVCASPSAGWYASAGAAGQTGPCPVARAGLSCRWLRRRSAGDRQAEQDQQPQGEPPDGRKLAPQPHAPHTAEGTGPRIAGHEGRQPLAQIQLGRLGQRRRLAQQAARHPQHRPLGAGVQAAMAHPLVLERQDVGQEAADELDGGQSHQLGLAAFRRIRFPVVVVREGHLPVFERHQAGIADGGAPEVAAHVLEQRLRAVVFGRLADVDLPLAGLHGLAERRHVQVGAGAHQPQLAALRQTAQARTEGVPKLLRERHHREQEARGALAPAVAGLGLRHGPGCDHAMQTCPERSRRMDVVLQRLAPEPVLSLSKDMQHRRHADLAAQVLAGKRLERLVGRAEQQIVDGLRVDLGQRIDPVIEREDHLKVRHGQQLHALLRQPLRPLERPAFGAVTIAARVVHQLHPAADVALPQMPAQGRRATLQDRIDGRKLLGGAVRHLEIVGEVRGQHIGQFQGRFDRCDVDQRT